MKTDLPPVETEAVLSEESILTKLRIWIFILLILVLISSNILLRNEVIPIVKENSNALTIQSGSHIVAAIQHELSTAKTLAISLANMATVMPKDEAVYHKTIPEIIDIKGLEHFIAGGGLWPEPYQFDRASERHSFFWGRDNSNSLQFYDDYNSLTGNGYHHEEWYVPVKYISKNKVYWSRSYADPYSHQPMVTVTAPIWDDEKFVGASTIDIKLEGIKKILKQSMTKLGGYGFIVDRNGKFISFPKQNIGLNLYEGDEYTHLSSITYQNNAFKPYLEFIEQINEQSRLDANAVLAEKIAEQSYQIELEEATLISSHYTPPINSEHNHYLSGFDIALDPLLQEKSKVMLFAVADTQWILAIVVPEVSYLSLVNELTKTITLYQVTGVSLIMFILFIVFDRVFSRPFHHLIRQLQQAISSKEYLSISYSDSNEFGLLAKWFNRRTEQLQQSENELRTSKSYLQNALDSANAGTLVYSIKNNSLSWDKQSYKIFDVDPNSFKPVYSSWRECVHPEDIEQAENDFQVALESKLVSDFSMEYRIKLRNGTIRWVQVTIKIERDEAGVAFSCGGLHLDVTDKKTAESNLIAKEAAEKSNMEKSEFLANISHELRTPTHGILSFSSFGIKNSHTGSRNKMNQYFSNIQISGQRLLALLNNLLDLSKFDAGKMTMEMNESNLNELVSICVREQSQQLDDGLIKVRHKDKESPVLGNFDKIRLSQVISNLLTNAIKFSPELTTISIETNLAEGQLSFSIEDQGVGIPLGEFNSIFDAFVQSSKTKTGAGGTGLGLAICKQIIDGHEGQIWAKNNESDGACFYFVIPQNTEKK